MTIAYGVLLLAVAIPLALPAVADATGWLASLRRRRERRVHGAGELPRLVFLVPAHDEELLIERTVRSLSGQDYPSERMRVVVVADNCSDSTATLARSAGADVLERRDPHRPGKHNAIGWALQQVEPEGFDAVVIIDGDTVVEPRFARELARHAPLQGRLVQCRVGVSNEHENWLTLLAGLLTRVRWDVIMPLKVRAGVSCPLTGNGSVLGREILRAFPWRIDTVTEGWELYARFTLAGLHTAYEPGARLSAQEARSLEQGGAQRTRWTAGRLAVLRRSLKGILRSTRLSLAQRLDLLAELSSIGPVTSATLGAIGAILAWVTLDPSARIAPVFLFSLGFLRPAVYSVVALFRHPDPMPVLRASTRIPVYVVWRMAVALRTLCTPSAGIGEWVRSERHQEP